MEERHKYENTLAVDAPEIQLVMSILNKEIQNLDDNVGNLVARLSGVLISERPKEENNDRPKRECILAEGIQENIDLICKLNDVISELRYRIAL